MFQLSTWYDNYLFCIHCIETTIYFVFTTQSQLSILYSLHRDNNLFCIHCIESTIYFVFTAQRQLSILYSLHRVNNLFCIHCIESIYYIIFHKWTSAQCDPPLYKMQLVLQKGMVNDNKEACRESLTVLDARYVITSTQPTTTYHTSSEYQSLQRFDVSLVVH